MNQIVFDWLDEVLGATAEPGVSTWAAEETDEEQPVRVGNYAHLSGVEPR